MVSVSLYIDGTKVDLFQDENISLTQSIQNVRDISKVFANFTQTFTIPASKVNNKVFKHYYNFSINNGFDARKKVDASIELNYLPFQKGKVQLIGVNLKNNEVFAYRIVFFGEIVDLKDILGEDKLNSLQWLGNFNRTYSAANVKADLESDGVDFTLTAPTPLPGTYTDALCLPLITNTSQLFYDSGVTPPAYFNPDGTINPLGANLYVSGNNGVYFEELKYAIRIYLIILAIEQSYAIEFDASSFFKDTTNLQYYDLYMWLHREKGFAFKQTQVTVTYNLFPSDTSSMTRVFSSPSTLTVFNLTGGETISYSLNVTTAPAAEFKVAIFRNGLLYAEQTFAGTTTGTILSGTLTNGNYTVSVTGTSSNSIALQWSVTDSALSEGPTTFSGTALTLPASNLFAIPDQIPEMRIIDFLTSLFKMFNLTAYKLPSGKIMVETLDDYYANGTLRRIDEYIDITSSQIDPALPYQQVTFEYEGRDTKLAALYEQAENVGWGTETFKIDNDILGNPYKISVGFEHMQFERLPGTDVQTGYFIDDNNEPYFGLPLIFYRQLITSGTPISFLSGPTSPSSIDDYCIPMNSVSTSDSTSAKVSHFFPETNEYTPTDTFDETLFSEYYEDYINDLFDTRRRLFRYKAVLPVGFLFEYGLQDTLQIYDTTYIINQITTNLTTGESTLELLNVIDPEFIEPTTTTTTTAAPTTTTTTLAPEPTTTTTTLEPTTTTTTSTTTTTTTVAPTTTTTSTTSTTTTTEAPLVYYRFEECENGTLVFQNLVSEPAVNSLWTDGVDFYTYIGPPTTLPGTIVTNLTGPIGTGCPTTTTTTAAPQTLKAEIQNCGGFTVWYVEFTNQSSLPNGFVIESSHPNLTGQCWEIIDNAYTGSLDFSTTTTATYTSCESCVPATTTTTSTTTTTTTTTSTTTTTTTAGVSCTSYNVLNEGATTVTFEYEACNSGVLTTFSVSPGNNTTVCARTGTLAYVSGDFNYSITNLGSC